tara:strand:+ start:2283 stop:3263 length:981 start_codon:yes stop_codon:yes gene_type:complete
MAIDRQTTVGVTGGAGMIGSYLVDALVLNGCDVIVIDDFSKGKIENLHKCLKDIEIREGNLEKKSFALNALRGCDIVFHLASRAYGVGYGHGRHLEVLHHNERVSTNVLSAVEFHRPKTFLVTSSSCVYDDCGPETLNELEIFEGEPEKVNLGYGWAKRFLEQKSLLLARQLGIGTIIVRPFNIYGERYNWMGEFSQAIPMLVKRIMDCENPVEVWGSGDQRRNYMHAKDCARYMMGLVEKNCVGETVNIGSASHVSIKELVTLIAERARLCPTFEFNTSKPEGRRVKSANIGKLQNLLPNYAPEIDLSDGIDRMLLWYKSTFSEE